MVDDAVWSELLSGLQAGSLRHAVVYRRDFWQRRFMKTPAGWASGSAQLPWAKRALVSRPSPAILLDLDRPDLDSWRFQTGDSGHLRDGDSAFDENGDSLLE